MKPIQMILAENNVLFLAFAICFMLIGSISHGVTIELSDAPSSWMPEFNETVSIKVTVRGNFHSRHTVVFNLSDITNWPGICMNDGRKTDRRPDLALMPSEQGGSRITWHPRDYPEHKSIAASFTSTRSQRRRRKITFNVVVSCYDYAAYGELSAIIYGSGGTSSSPLNSSSSVTIPRDENGNKIADRWLYNSISDTTRDRESGPGSNTNRGDGFTVLEEYRGFMVSGRHERIDPLYKDLFVYSSLREGLGYASNIQADNQSTFRVHQIYWREMDGNNLVMNSRQCSGYSYIEQRAVRVVRDSRTEADAVDYAYGEAFPKSGYQSPNIPAYMRQAVVYVKSIDRQLNKSIERGRISQSEAIRLVIGHEVGHHVHLDDDPLGSRNNADGTANSIMSYTDYLYQRSPNFPRRYHENEYDLTD